MPAKALYKKAAEPSRINPHAGKIRKERVDCLMAVSCEWWNSMRFVFLL